VRYRRSPCSPESVSNSDIKPHNLLLLSSGHLQLTDFGSAAPLFTSASVSASNSSTSRLPFEARSIPRKFAVALVGTPDYIAPEVLRYAERIAEESNDFDTTAWRESEEERAYGCEVDWWAVGVVLYEVSSDLRNILK
jgi:serine/threonine protein kinase